MRTVNDTAPPLSGTVPADLTGATAHVHVRKPDGTVIDREVDVIVAAAGTWSMAWQDGDLDQVGLYAVELEVVFGGGAKQTFGYTLTGERTAFRANAQLA